MRIHVCMHCAFGSVGGSERKCPTRTCECGYSNIQVERVYHTHVVGDILKMGIERKVKKIVFEMIKTPQPDDMIMKTDSWTHGESCV